MPTEHQGADARRNKRARLLSPGFSLGRHLVAFAALATAAIAVAMWLVRRAHISDLWIVPAYLLAANLVEYLVHRFVMHRPLWPRSLYRGHTLGHHRAFHHDSMEVGAWREMELVMMPWFTVAVLFIGLGPLVALVAGALGPGPAGLLLMTGVCSFILYEGLHALYHFPLPVLGQLGLRNNRIFAWLLRHHLHHHRLSRMRWVNFNISIPLSDRLFGTLEIEADWEAAHVQRMSGRASPERVVVRTPGRRRDRQAAGHRRGRRA